MEKLEKLMQDVMKLLKKKGFEPDAMSLKIKVGENTYAVNWKQPVIYAAKTDEFDNELRKKIK